MTSPAPDERLLAAARACPTMAIRLADDDGAAVFPVGWIPSGGLREATG